MQRPALPYSSRPVSHPCTLARCALVSRSEKTSSAWGSAARPLLQQEGKHAVQGACS